MEREEAIDAVAAVAVYAVLAAAVGIVALLTLGEGAGKPAARVRRCGPEWRLEAMRLSAAALGPAPSQADWYSAFSAGAVLLGVFERGEMVAFLAAVPRAGTEGRARAELRVWVAATRADRRRRGYFRILQRAVGAVARADGYETVSATTSAEPDGRMPKLLRSWDMSPRPGAGGPATVYSASVAVLAASGRI